MCVLFLSATLHVHFIHGQLLVHLYALLSCHAVSVKCFYKSCFLWQINDDDDDDDDDDGVLCSNACTKQRFVTSMTCKNA